MKGTDVEKDVRKTLVDEKLSTRRWSSNDLVIWIDAIQLEVKNGRPDSLLKADLTLATVAPLGNLKQVLYIQDPFRIHMHHGVVSLCLMQKGEGKENSRLSREHRALFERLLGI